MSYLNDPREMAIRPESGVTLEEDNRYEEMWHWGAHVLDLCNLPVEEYMKPMTVNVGEGGGGGGSDTGSTTPTYFLKFVLDGVTKKSFNLEEGAPIPEVSGEREGYDFSGWADSNGNTPTAMPAANLTLYGTTSIKKFTIKFSVDGEELSDYEQVINWGGKVTNIPSSAKTGYNFSGWEPAIPSTVKNNYTFVGTFTKKSYSVSFNISGDIQTATFEYGDTIVYPAADSKEGYTICGWTPYHETMPDTNNLVFRAVLSANSYSVKYLIDAGAGMDNEIVAEYTVKYGQAIPSQAVPVQSGYSFSQWSADTQLVGNKMPAKDVNFFSTKTVNNYTLKYFIDGVQDGPTETYSYGAPVTPRDKYEKEGYTVTEWVFDHELTDGVGGKGMPYYNVEARCETSINSYNVVVKYGNTVLYSEALNYGTSLANVVPEGYTYSGDVTTVPAHDVELEVSINTYNVTLLIDGVDTVVLPMEYNADIMPAVEDYINNSYPMGGYHIESNIPNGAKVPAHDVQYEVNTVPNKHNVYVMSGTGAIITLELNYGDNILAALNGVVDDLNIDEYHYLAGWAYTSGTTGVGPDDVLPDNNEYVTPIIVVKESEVTPVVSGETATGSTTYDYGTPISEIIEDIIASASPETKADLEDPGYQVDWTVNGSAYTDGMVVKEDEVVVEATITPKPFKLSFMRRASDAAVAGVIESGETLYKEEIVYPTLPASIELSGRTFEFKWDEGSVEEGTPMPSSAVTVYGTYVEKVGATNIFYGGIMDRDLGTNPDFAAFAQSMSSASLTAMPEYIVYRLPSLEDEYNDFPGEDEEWIPEHMYTFFAIVPQGKAVTQFRVGATNQPNIAGSIYEKSFGTVTIDGLAYDVYGYQRDNYYVMDSPEVAQVYITVE